LEVFGECGVTQMKKTVEAAMLRKKQEAFAQIRRDLREGLRKKQLEDQAKAIPPPKPKLEATVLEFPPKLSDQELIRRQQIIDQAWERVLEERRRLEEVAARSCHRGSSDSDWNL
jgi:hypothetical protein